MSKAKTVVLKLLSAWQWTRRFRQPACRFYPSCSEYTRQAVEKHGIAAGVRLGFVRICKCHPFHDGGVDEVPEVLTPLIASHKVRAAYMSCLVRCKTSPINHFPQSRGGLYAALSGSRKRLSYGKGNRYENRTKTGFCRKQR